MLALSFIGILLIATIMTIIFVTNQYSKGLTLKAINQAGRDVGAAIKRDSTSIASIPTPLIQPDTLHAGKLGRLCLGSYSYVWSKAGDLVDGSAPKYTSSTTPIVFARVSDGGGELCRPNASGDYPTDISKDDSATYKNAVEMLPNDKGDYALRSMEYTKTNNPYGQEVLYDIVYVIGTNQKDTINTVFGYEQCDTPDANTNNYNFCAINKFELMIRAGYDT